AAVSVAAAFRPELALLDIGMPDCSGHEVAAALRREPWGRDIYIVALTGWGQEEDKTRAAASGFDRHLTKPLDPDALESLASSAFRAGAERRRPQRSDKSSENLGMPSERDEHG